MLKPCRVHITGASGAGTTTLGRALAQHWSVPYHDTDDYFWEPTDPPFTTKRPAAERLRLMQALFLPRTAWVLTGSLMGWGDSLIPLFDRVVFLRLDPEVRLARLRHREVARYDAAALAPGEAGDEAHQAFMAWAEGYDDPAFEGRSLARHRVWLERLPQGYLELDSAEGVEALVGRVLGDEPASLG